ncbi:DUF5304 domain-containing protein [Streptomyces sp. TRM64462]|uniref:DUF5304 domain-containing protein n=1 Tax=Streptomyces sp. TRM64462 TaxID=2741726 RepID=UPI001585DA35|nr:DUF5304 domain-containing protein [Streptomyces sp. TRM64462]
MSDATERPGRPEDDAWAQACAEDLAAERARRRGSYAPPPGSAAEELRKLVDAVTEKVSTLGGPLLGKGAQGAVRNLVDQARSAIEPVVERNPQVFDHLAAAGSELLAAYRSAVQGHEQRWTRPDGRPADAASPRPEGGPKEDGGGPAGSEQIDLD